MNTSFKRLGLLAKHAVRWECTITRTCHSTRCKLLVVGGGTGGLSIAWRFAKKLQPKNIILLEPSESHYYQPGYTLVAAGIYQLKKVCRLTQSLLPPGITWVQDRVQEFDPCENAVYTLCGTKIVYEFMVVAIGIRNDYDKIVGLTAALNDPRSHVSTIYASEYCPKTWCDMHLFKGGHAVFTYPDTGGKCPGAIIKVMLLADDYWRKHKIRQKVSITFNTANSTIFGIPTFAKALTKLASDRNIVVNCNTNLLEVNPAGAVFKSSCNEMVNFPYNMLVVSPPMVPPTPLSRCKYLANSAGYLDVDKHTLQHRCFANVFGLGDCTSTPNSKTAAAIGPQSQVLQRNLLDVMAGKTPQAKYNGYGACPLVTSYRKSMLAEFLYEKELCSTFPFDQSKERRMLYHINVRLMPTLYWRCLVKGKYNGPQVLRKIINPFGRK